MWFAACGCGGPAYGAPAEPAEVAGSIAAGTRADAPPDSEHVVMYLARRRWHIDVGFAVHDLDPSLAVIAQRFPQAKYLFFGFGDRHYLLSKRKDISTLAGALFPGPGLVLVTAIENSPAQAFGAPHVIELALADASATAAQRFVRRTLGGGDIAPFADGPYEGSAYYEAVPRYSALHTCNTWAAEAMQSAGLEVHTRLVLFAGQTWNQARKINRRARARTTALGILAPGIGDLSRRAADCRSDTRLSSWSPAGPPPWSSAGEAGSSC
jgi:hypothetical protein